MVLPKQGTNLAPIGGESQHTYMQSQQSLQKRFKSIQKSNIETGKQFPITGLENT